jgi:hypothetical protein
MEGRGIKGGEVTIPQPGTELNSPNSIILDSQTNDKRHHPHQRRSHHMVGLLTRPIGVPTEGKGDD